MKIAVVGGGISGVAAARVLQASGHEVVLLERGEALGGVWTRTYPGVRLQNVAEHYRLGDFPWPFAPDLHPTGAQILRYIAAAAARYRLDVRLRHAVTAMTPRADGWTLALAAPDGPQRLDVDYVVLAVGQYSQDPLKPALPGRERFAGEVVTDREVQDLDRLAGKRVVVVGMGKSAVDMAAFAAERGSQVHHVFRAARWLLPQKILGVHAKELLFARMSTAMIPAWVRPSAAERALHGPLRPLVAGFWAMITALVRGTLGLHPLHRDPAARRRLRALLPDEPLTYQMRSAVALAPASYYPAVARGAIEPVRGELAAFTGQGVRLQDGRELACDLVVLSLGCPSPAFPFLPAELRAALEDAPDGAQLYRHILHPRVPRVAFAGFNHGFLHVPAVEIAMVWLAAHLRGDLALPAAAEMERCIDELRAWKRRHTLFEPSRGCAINTRFHQYADVLLADLGLRPYRKAGLLAELTQAYTAADYAGLVDEYERVRATLVLPRTPLPVVN